MLTPVSTARQCLTEEAAAALDDAVAVARRRSHAQTTSLHAVSALLALQSSTLRDACGRAKSSAYSLRLQFRALDLCVGVSLDRLPTTKAQEEPPISNSLMAAIKRSQANQRRHPETFHLYQQLQYQSNSSNSSSPPSISTVKVELKHFILSILDDPIVSRVFGEAGFRSCDIKLAILNPPTTISRFSKTRCPPLFLCNFSFPFSGVLNNSEGVNGNSRRIGDVLLRKSGNNPLLVGVCANDALNEFLDNVQKGKSGCLPKEIDGLSLISVEKEISMEMLRLKFKQVDDLIKGGCKGAGVIFNYGDLEAFVDDEESMETANYVVSCLSKLVEVHYGKIWLIGAASSYDIYMKFLALFPSIEKDWDLHLLPITFPRPPTGGLVSRSGLMGSFVPFGGFFPSASDYESTWSNKNQSTSRCNICNEKYEQEASVLKGGSTVSVADQCSSNLSSCLRMAESDKSKQFGTEEASDDRTVLNARLMGLQTKWNEICHRLHRCSSLQQNVSSAKPQVSNVDSFQYTSARSDSVNTSLLLDGRKFTDPSSYMPSNLQSNSLLKPNVLKPVPSIAGIDSRADVPMQGLRMGNFWNPSCAVGSLSLLVDHKTSSSVTSETTDLGLGTIYASTEEGPSKTKSQEQKLCLPKFSQGSVSADTSSGNASSHIGQSSVCSVPLSKDQSDKSDFKYLLRILSEKVGWQEEAVYTISQTVASCKSGLGRRRGSRKGNIWLSFLGPDKVGKRRIAASLAEATFGSKQNLLQVEFGSVDKISCSNTLFDRQDPRSNDLKFREKTFVDHIAEGLSKKPQSVVVLLENIDKADLLVQHSLEQAMRTGKFPDSHGREISCSNVIFVITSRDLRISKDSPFEKLPTEYSEERILSARDFQMQISIGRAPGDGIRSGNTNVPTDFSRENIAPFCVGKRKPVDDIEPSLNKVFQKPKRACEASRSCLDLNLPVEEMEEDDDGENNDSDSGSESSKAWLEEFLDQVDKNVYFKPFDFNALSQKVLKDVSPRLRQIFGSNYLLEIDSEVVVQILAAAWLSESKKALEDWIEEVLCRSFREAQQRYNLSPDHVVKLIPCQSLVENHAPGICLPAKVTVN